MSAEEEPPPPGADEPGVPGLEGEGGEEQQQAEVGAAAGAAAYPPYAAGSSAEGAFAGSGYPPGFEYYSSYYYPSYAGKLCWGCMLRVVEGKEQCVLLRESLVFPHVSVVRFVSN